MNRLSFLLFALGIVLIGGGAAWYLVDTRNDAFGSPETATTTPEVREGLSIYTNGTYGFTVFYPADAAIEYDFSPDYHLGSSWRANALPDVTGNPIVSIIPYTVASEDFYPRYFNAMVRIGASDDEREVARCLVPAQGEAALPDATINGIAWKAFSFQSAGMMQYASGISYRTIRDGECLALEQARTGSSYREAPTDRDIPESTLEAEYAALDAIVESFSFAR